MQANSIYERPDLYDLLAPADPVIEHFYVGAAGGGGRRVLDLACGSGRLAIPLAEAGAKVTGGDLSSEMLQRAQLAARRRDVEVELVQLDMRDFNLKGQLFDTILVAMNSILHLHSLDDFRGFFQSVARHLTDNGRLIFDAFVPSLALLNRGPDERQLVGKIVDDELGNITVEETVRYDPITQISHIEWYWSTDEEKDFWQTPLRMRQIFPQEMPLLVAMGGLQLTERFGDFDRSAFASSSRRQVCVCVRAKDQ